MIKQIHNDLLRKKYSATELTKEYINKIKEKAHLNAYITLCEKEAVSEAEKVDDIIKIGGDLSILSGVTYSLKDNFARGEIPTTCGSKMLENFVPGYNAQVYELLKNKGAVMLGKANMDEFGMGSTSETSYYGKILNPLGEGYTPGGSSGGSAVTVAGGLAAFSIGSDTGGSVRVPASYCGITGFKPTYGAVSRYGLIAYASSMDTVGIMAENTDDVKIIFDSISSYDHRDSTMLPKISQQKKYSHKICVTGNDDNIVKAAKLLEKAGMDVTYKNMDETIEYAVKAYYIIACSEAASNLGRFDSVAYGHRCENYESLEEMMIKSRSEGFGDEVKKRIIFGNYILSNRRDLLLNAEGLRRKIKEQMKTIFENADFVLMPVVTGGAKRYLEMREKFEPETDKYTVIANLTGMPAISMPFGKNDENMPLSIGIMADNFCDEALLSFAKEVEVLLRGE